MFSCQGYARCKSLSNTQCFQCSLFQQGPLVTRLTKQRTKGVDCQAIFYKCMNVCFLLFSCQVYSRLKSLPNTESVQYSVFQQGPPSYRPVATPQGKVHSLNNVGWTLNYTLLSTGRNIHSTTPYNVHTLHSTLFSNVHTLHSTLHCFVHTYILLNSLHQISGQ